jgi:glycolate oxidase
MLTKTVKDELDRIVGAANASFSKEELLCYAYDAANDLHMPDGVVFPSTAEEVSLILKMANSEGFPVIPRGAGTGFTGGSVPVEGGVVLSSERMNKVIEIDAANLIAVVEPGLVTWELNQEVAEVGLFYPPDPTSLKFSTIGGNIAECAGGPRALKYGVTRDYVLGLEVVLPTGDIINTGVRTMKGVVGYDLTRLIVGSEGTLGVVTKATLRLLPAPASVVTLMAVFDGVKAAAGAVAAIIEARMIPSALEIMDSASVKCVQEYSENLTGAGSILLIEVDGSVEQTQSDAEAVEALCRANGASKVSTATGKYEAKDLWKARRSISPSLFKLKPDKINEDVVVPRSKIIDLMTGIEKIAATHGLLIACFGHAGDGNIHMNVMFDKKDPKEAAAAGEAVREAFELTLALGGTISGEHGIGTTKAGYLSMELGPVEIETMRSIKRVFDPKAILNPGKIFPKGSVPPAATEGTGPVRV